MRCKAALISLLTIAASSIASAGDDEPQVIDTPAVAPASTDCGPGTVPTRDQAQACADADAKKQQDAVAAKTAAESALAKLKEAIKKAEDAVAAAPNEDAKKQQLEQLKQSVSAAEKAVADAKAELEKANARLDASKKVAETARLNAEGTTAFKEQDCKNELVLCVLWTGAALLDDAPPDAVAAGTILTVKVFSTKKEQEEKTTATVSFSQRKGRDSLFEGTKEHGSDVAAEKTAEDAIVLNHVFVDDPIGDDIEQVVILVSPSVEGHEPKAFTVRIDRGFSYYSFAFMVAATYEGDRTIYRDLSVKQDTALEPAFALNVFPFGRPRGVIGYVRTCPNAKRCLANTLGFQFGTDLDLTDPLDRVFAGLVFEPVAGLALTAGLSVRQVNFAVPASDLPAMLDADVPIPTVKGRVLRPYLGVSITFDILDTLAKIKVPARAN